MGHFFCARCSCLADSHDGCDEVNGRLICQGCIDNEPDAEAQRECAHHWTPMQAGVTHMDARCDLCGVFKRTTWD